MSEVDPIALELYKVAVEMADRVSARRGTANAFFITVQSAFLGVWSLAVPVWANAPVWSVIAAVGVGITLSGCWWLQLRSYRDLNRAKFEVIFVLEKNLPTALFADEWASLKADPVKGWRGRYAELGAVERFVPGVFAALYLLLLAGRITS